MVFQFNSPRQARLDPLDDQILKAMHEGKSLKETGKEVGRSWSGVRNRCYALEEAGYIDYNPGKARARTLTPQGKEYLLANGLLPQEVFRT